MPLGWRQVGEEAPIAAASLFGQVPGKRIVLRGETVSVGAGGFG